jgi:nucleoid-associated protein YgaU
LGAGECGVNGAKFQTEPLPTRSLWSLAAERLGNPYLWPALYRANERVITHAQRFKERRHMKGPDWIFDGAVLTVDTQARNF